MPRLRLAFCLLLLFGSTALIAQTTGTLSGKVTDANGGALPGVTVEAKSPTLQGTRTASSDAGGDYRFALLPPGEYSVAFRLEGLAPENRKSVMVSLDKDTSLDVVMKPAAVSAEIVVSATAPVLDTTSTTPARTSTRAPSRRSRVGEITLRSFRSRRAYRRMPIPAIHRSRRSASTAHRARRIRSSSTASTPPMSNTGFKARS